MQIKMNDKVETNHASFPDIEKGGRVKVQKGVIVMSEVPSEADGMKKIVQTVLLAKGAVLDVPDRLGQRLIKIGHASEVSG